MKKIKSKTIGWQTEAASSIINKKNKRELSKRIRVRNKKICGEENNENQSRYGGGGR